MKNKYRITNNKFSHLPLVIFVLFVIGTFSILLSPLPALAVTENVIMDGTNQIIYDNNGVKMPTGEVIQIIYASNEAIHSPGLTGEATGGDSIIWTGSVGQGGLGDGAFVKAFAGGQSLIDGNRIYVRAWNSSTILTSTYYGDSQLSSTLDAGSPPMPKEWYVPTFYASTEFAGATVPAAPSNATLEALSTTSMKLTWQDNSTGEQGFRIEMSTSESWTDIVTVTVEADITSYEAGGLSTNEAYWFRVNAYNTVGNSGYATAESRYTMANAPLNPSVLGVNGATYDCYISWESGGIQTGFAVYRDYPEKLGGTLIYTGTATTTVDVDLVAGQAHFYYIYGYNGDARLTSYVSSADSTSLPGTPEGLVTTNITTDTAYGTWEAGSYTGYFVISYGTYATATGESLVTTDEAAWTFTNLSPTTTYYWKVAGVNINGTSEYSSIASFTTATMPLTNIPGTPEGLTISNISNHTAYGTWEANGADYYTISYGTYATATGESLVTTDEAAYTFTGLTATTEYFWKVSASNTYGTSEYSSISSFETLLFAPFSPAAPSNATLEALSITAMRITWQDNSTNELGFRVEWTTSESWTDIVYDIVAAVTSYEADDLITNEAYWFRVNSYNAAGDSEYATTESKYTMANAPVNPSVLGVNGATYDCYISWESGGKQTGFAVYRDYPEILGGTLIYTGTAATTVDANLVAGQAHFYYIYGYNGDYQLTSYVSSADSTSLPGTPEGLVTTNITTNTAYGTWETVSGAGYFVLSYGTQESAADTLVITNEAAYSFTMLNPATEYFWKVAAVNVNGTSEYSSTAFFTTEASGAPNIPTGLEQYRFDGITVIATGEWIGEATVEFRMSMTSLVNNTLYPEVEIKPVGTDFTGTITATGEGQSYSGTAVTGIVTLENIAEGPYHWQARVRSASGLSSGWESFGGNADPADRDFGVDMTPPTNTFTLTKPDSGSWQNTQTPTFEWTSSSDDLSGLARYELWIDSVKNKDVSSTETSATPEASLSDGVHTWEVKAVDYAGNVSSSASSWEVNIDTLAPAVSMITPESNATGVFLFPNIIATFNDSLTAGTITASNFIVTGDKTGAHATNPSYNSATNTVTFNQTGLFVTNETVTCTVDVGVQDKAGNPMAAPYILTFTTTTENPPATSLTLKVYLQGYYLGGGSQRATSVEVEVRSGSDPGSATGVATSEIVSLDATGTGTVDINAMGDYYVVVKHMTSTTEGANHLSIITNDKVTFGGGTASVNVSEPSAGDFFAAYTPATKASMPAMFTESDSNLVMRGGNADGDRVITASIDFPIWLTANGADPTKPNWDINADFDGDLYITASVDFPIWLTNNGYESYVP